MAEPQPFRIALEASLQVLASERPAIAARLGKHLHGRTVLLTVDGERLRLTSHGSVVSLTPHDGHAPADVDVNTSREAILALVDGTDHLMEAIVGGRTRIRGEAMDLVAFEGALHAYLDGAVRIPEMAERWKHYRGDNP